MAGKILIVEDDEVNRKLFVSLLRARGYEVSEASDGQQAVEQIEREAPSLILMDIVLPKMSGIEVVRTCREKGLLQRSKVYALTASDMPEIERARFEGVIAKPVRVREFLDIIERIWEPGNT